jgi:hypothetical protein
VPPQQLLSFQADRAIAQGGSLGAAGDNPNVQWHGQDRPQVSD